MKLPRSIVALSLAFAMLLPTGAIVGAPAVEPLPLGATPGDGLEILPYEWDGDYLPLAKVTDTLLPGLGLEGTPKAEPAAWALGGGSRIGAWLRDVHAGGMEPDYEIISGPVVATHTTVVIDTNQKISGSVSYDDVTLLFTTAAIGHRTIEVLPGGSLTITNSIIKSEDRINYGLIQARGALTLDNNDISEMVIFSQDANQASVDPIQHAIKNNYFTDNVYGVFTDRDNVLIQDNVFFKNSYGIWVDQPAQGGFLDASTPTVLENTFEMNEVGILVYTDQNSGDADPVGTYTNNIIRANIIGVQCYSNGWTNPDNAEDTRHSTFEDNNIYSNWGDAVNNLRGITIIVPLIGPVSVADSACNFDGNYFGTDSLFTSSADEVTNNANAPLTLASTPPLPYAIQAITNSQTWNSGNPPPPINGPVIVQQGGSLTINGITLSTGFTIGSAKGGNLDMDGVTVNDGNGIVIRNDGDLIQNSDFLGTQLFSPVTLFRNNATIRDSTFVGEGRDRGTAVSLVAGQFTEDFTWSPDLINLDISNSRFGIQAVTMTVTMTGTKVKDIGLPKWNFPLQSFLTGGFMGVIVTLNSDDNTYENVGGAVGGQLVTLNANGDVYDGGFSAFATAALNTASYTDSVIANYEFGVMMLLDTSLTITDSNLTHNAYGIFSVITNPTVSATNFYNNYLQAMYPYSTTANVSGTLNFVTSTITCTNCWSPSDESWLSQQGSSVAYTSALAPNDVRKPSWSGSVKEAVGAGNVVTIASGTLQGPVVARQGGEVKIENVDIDLNKRFSIGAKGGGNSGGSTGKLTITGSRLSNGGFIATNSSNANANIKNNLFRDFTSGSDLFNVHWQGPTIECNDVDMDAGYPGRVSDTRQNLNPVLLKRNKFTDSGDLDVGFGLGGDVLHNATVTFEQNSMVGGTSSLGQFWLIMNGTHSVRENNLLSNPSNRAVTNSQRPLVVGGQSSNPVALKAENGYWGHSSGPSVLHGVGEEQNPGAEGLVLFSANQGPKPIWSPFKSSANAFDPCIGWRYSPLSPIDHQTLSFDSSLTFDPSGLDIASYSWNFNGEGSSSLANPSFKFPDGGSKSVTPTVTTDGGKTASLTKTISIAHSAPVAGFSQVVSDEITDAMFTDTSTHPNTPTDDPPTGWTYAWTFGDGGTSSLRNPSHRYADGGTYTVQLTVTDNDGQSNSKSTGISVAHVAPVAGFNVAGTLETDTYQFTDTSTHPNAPNDGIASRSWSCTDGFTSTAQNPTHKFADGGSYSCTLTVTDNDGLSDSETKGVSVAHVGPAAGFTSVVGSELVDAVFTDTSTHPNAPTDAPPAGWAWTWDFGDGATSAVRSPTHNYADGGSYTVDLTVTDNDGLTSSVSKAVTVTHVAPVAAFSFAPGNPDPGEDVAFTDLSTHPNAPVDGIASWAWDFGDGATSTLQSPLHAFADMGLFDVELCVTDNDLLSSCITIRVPVGNNPPEVAWTYSPANPTDLDTVQFTDMSTDSDGTLVSWFWDFGDGSTSTDRNPTHQFTDNGDYTVSLTVTDNLGASTTLSKVIPVLNVGPTASFTYGPSNPQVNENIQFSDTSNDPDGTIVSRLWDFGDGTTSTAQNPVHSYPEGGDYVVTITVTDDDGATATASQTVHVCETQVNLDSLFGGTNGPLLELCLRIEI